MSVDNRYDVSILNRVYHLRLPVTNIDIDSKKTLNYCITKGGSCLSLK